MNTSSKFRFSRIKAALLIPAILLLTQCATYYKFFGEESTYFSKEEIVLLERTTRAVNFDYGFDVDMKLDYVFATPSGSQDKEGVKKALSPKDKDLSAALKGVDAQALRTFSEKIYKLHVITQDRMEEYKKRRDWKNSTFIEKYLLPSLGRYADMLEKHLLAVDRSYAPVLSQRKKEIEEQVKVEKRLRRIHQVVDNDFDI